ncbi:hypothetical protein DCC35_14035 [Mangrovivirga cuniculi]|uniref:YCII-related domain-containing protein n=2 Tax=Mangrovivirga cuniculi TaxID=2715131 RepID=A0A4D7JYL0_9BACT|nr:hypothetical protein DCC35_14035 [Mangrovivirga cuniculi]
MPNDVLAKTQNTPPEEAKKGMERWQQWAEKCEDHLVDLGNPLANGEKINVDGSTEKSEREVVGYSILQAKDINHAKELLKDHPHLSGWDDSCEIEVHEAMDLPG